MAKSISNPSIRQPRRRRAAFLGLLVLALAGLVLACTHRPPSRPRASMSLPSEDVNLPPEPPEPVPTLGDPPPPPGVEEAWSPAPLPTLSLPGDDAESAAQSSGGRRRPPQASPVLVDKSLRFVRLFYGTNRARTAPCAQVAAVRWDERGRCRPGGYYGGLPASGAGEETRGLEVGTLAVTFPPRHAQGKIERPLQIFTVSFRDEDPSRDVVISELRSFGGDHAAWARELRATGRDQAFIYVHGFETSFDQAARRAAQLAYDLDFDLEQDFKGVPMFFSWPSRGGVDSYMADYDASFESLDAFNRFLDLVKQQAGIRRVHIIAHSMGNRVVTEALYARAAGQSQPIVDELILAAPDVWARRFKDHFLRTLPKLASRVTLYVSDHDRALLVSRRIRDDEPRAGDVAGGLLEASHGVERFDAVNASTLESDFLGHGYYASHGSMLGDIYCLLKGIPATGRPLLVLAGTAWQFRPPAELAKLEAGACRAAVAAAGAVGTTGLPIAPPPPVPPSPWLPWGAAGVGAVLLAAAVLRFLRRRAV